MADAEVAGEVEARRSAVQGLVQQKSFTQALTSALQGADKVAAVKDSSIKVNTPILRPSLGRPKAPGLGSKNIEFIVARIEIGFERRGSADGDSCGGG